MFNNFFFENRTVYETMWKNIVKPGRPQVNIWRMRITCWAPTSTNSHPEHVLLIAYLLQQFRTTAPECYFLLVEVRFLIPEYYLVINTGY